MHSLTNTCVAKGVPAAGSVCQKASFGLCMTQQDELQRQSWHGRGILLDAKKSQYTLLLCTNYITML